MAASWDAVFRNMQRDDVLQRTEVVRDYFGGSAANVRVSALAFARTLDASAREIFLRCDFHGERAACVASDIGFSVRHLQRHRRRIRNEFVRFVECGGPSDADSVVEAPVLVASADPRTRRGFEVLSRSAKSPGPRKSVAAELGISVRTLYRDLNRARAALENARHDEDERVRLEAQTRFFLDRVNAAWSETAYSAAKAHAEQALARARALIEIQSGTAPDALHARTLLAETLLWCQNTERQAGSASRADDRLREAARLAAECELPQHLRHLILLTKARTALTWPGGYREAADDLNSLPEDCAAHPLFNLTQADIALQQSPAAHALTSLESTVQDVLAGAGSPEDRARFLLAAVPGLLRLHVRGKAFELLKTARVLARPGGRNELFSYILEAELRFARRDLTGARCSSVRSSSSAPEITSARLATPRHCSRRLRMPPADRTRRRKRSKRHLRTPRGESNCRNT